MTSKANLEGGFASRHLLRRPQPSLPQLCDQAANHVARARIALFEETSGSDQALAHLDEAIGCLKRLWQHGTAPESAAPEEAPADLPQRRSA